jgi:predicted ATPase
MLPLKIQKSRFHHLLLSRNHSSAAWTRHSNSNINHNSNSPSNNVYNYSNDTANKHIIKQHSAIIDAFEAVMSKDSFVRDERQHKIIHDLSNLDNRLKIFLDIFFIEKKWSVDQQKSIPSMPNQSNQQPAFTTVTDCKDADSSNKENSSKQSNSSSSAIHSHNDDGINVYEMTDSQLKAYQLKKQQENDLIAEQRLKHRVKGMYIHGSTGSGKTMMMDLFFNHCCVPANLKHRTHFHSFMLDIHDRLHKLRKMPEYKQVSDPLKYVAEQLVKEKGFLLCLDEFQVTDVADAMILMRLFSAIFYNSGVLVATSNRAPDDLYYGGLNREVFLPFIPYIKQRCQVVSILNSPDYRTIQPVHQDIYFSPDSDENIAKIKSIWNMFCDVQGGKQVSIKVPVMMGRTLTIDKASVLSVDANGQVNKACCWIDFRIFGSKEIGSADYLALAKYCPVVIITGIPEFVRGRNRDSMRRFINLIDILYDNHAYVVFCADKLPQELFNSHDVEDTITAKLYRDSITGGNTSFTTGYTKILGSNNSKESGNRNNNVNSKTLNVNVNANVNVGSGGAAGATGATMTVSGEGGASGRSTTKIGNTEWSATGIQGASLYDLTVKSKEDEVFAFARTVSRLMEMQSVEYIDKAFKKYLEIVNDERMDSVKKQL